MKKLLEVTEELKIPDGEVWFTWDNERDSKRILAIYQKTPSGGYRRASVRLDHSQVAELLSLIRKDCFVPKMSPKKNSDDPVLVQKGDVVAVKPKTNEVVVQSPRHEPKALYRCPECRGLSTELVCAKCSKEE